MSKIPPIVRRFGLLAMPVVAAAALLVAGCGNYSEKTVSPLPTTVGTSTTGAGTTGEATTTSVATTTAEATTTAAAATTGGDPAAGKTVFASAGCAACHTLKAAGASGAVGPNLDTAKPSADLVLSRVTKGMGAMPPFGSSLSATQIDDVVAYVTSVAGK